MQLDTEDGIFPLPFLIAFFFPAVHRASFQLSIILLIYIKPSSDSYSSECGCN